MPRYHFEDFSPGTADVPGSITVTAEEIVAFAREFDAQPFHTDQEAAKKTFAGGLIASGWQSCGFLMRLVADGFINDSSSMGAPGVEELKWLKPVRPGDRLRARRTVLESKTSQPARDGPRQIPLRAAEPERGRGAQSAELGDARPPGCARCGAARRPERHVGR
jgi:acyl dehydratase